VRPYFSGSCRTRIVGLDVCRPAVISSAKRKTQFLLAGGAHLSWWCFSIGKPQLGPLVSSISLGLFLEGVLLGGDREKPFLC